MHCYSVGGIDNTNTQPMSQKEAWAFLWLGDAQQKNGEASRGCRSNVATSLYEVSHFLY